MSTFSRRRSRPSAEVLEGRALLAVGITVVPVATPVAVSGDGGGNVYFAQGRAGQVGWIDAQGKVHEIALPAGVDGTAGVAALGFGETAFTEPDAHAIGLLNDNGQIAEFSLPTAGARPGAIAGNPIYDVAWFAETVDNPALSASRQVNRIGEITEAGVITEFPLPAGVEADALTIGPDGNVWFLDRPGNAIGRMSADGSVRLFQVPTGPDGSWGGAIGLTGLAAGNDGNLWFTEAQAQRIGRLTPAGQFTFDTPTAPNASPTAITAGPDGDLWFTESTSAGAELGRLDPGNGQITNIALPAGFVAPVSITADAPGAVAIADPAGHRIGLVATDPHVGFEILTPSPVTGIVEFQGVADRFIAVATFQTSLPGTTPADYHATISWGDGTTSAGSVGPYVQDGLVSVAPGYPGIFQVNGAHTYAHAGTYAVRVTITDAFGIRTGVTTGITVSPGPFALVPMTPTPKGMVNTSSYYDLAYLVTAPGDNQDQTGDTVTIHWGDGTTSAGSVQPIVRVAGNGLAPFFTVVENSNVVINGQHAYTHTGTFAVTYTVTDKAGDSRTGQTQVQVVPTVQGSRYAYSNQPSLLAGVPQSGVVVAYLSSEITAKDSASNYTATISWGDGTTSVGTVVNAPFSTPTSYGGQFEVIGSHTYAHAGTFPLSVTIRGVGFPAQTLPGYAVVIDPAQFQVSSGSTPIKAVAGQPLAARLPVFLSERPGVKASDYTATIQWGDGTPASRGVVSVQYVYPNLGYAPVTTLLAIKGTHTFAHSGTYFGTVTIRQDDGKTSQELVEFDVS